MTDYSPRKGMSAAEINATVAAIIAEATLEEKVAMMSGRGFFKAYRESGGLWGAVPYQAGGGLERLNVPALFFTDGPRGVARGQSTCFPCTMARGATFDPDLERRVGEVMGIEARAQDTNLSGAVCVNLLRHPAWGRAQETYGEDPYHLGVMGAELAVGIQTHNIIATVKHFALNSIENARFKVDVQIDARTLREVYLPHFKRIIDAGCASVMSAYNKMNGEYCGQHRELLTDILRHEWGFDGFVHSDWVMGVYQPYGAAAGLDIENPEPIHFGQKLIDAVNSGGIEPGVIDTACGRILRTLYRFACAENPLAAYSMDLVAQPSHIAIAKEAALKSAVLLKNDGTLPLKGPASVGVFGRLADVVNTGDNGSSRVRPPHVITPLAGIAELASKTNAFGSAIALCGTEADIPDAASAAKGLDTAIVVVGYTAVEEGEYIPGDINLGQEVSSAVGEEIAAGASQRKARGTIGGDRVSLRLPPAQVDLIRAVAKSAKHTVVVIVAGSAVLIDEWVDEVGAVLQTFYSGMEGGSALAELLDGTVSPSGKLPFTIAAKEEDYPFFDKDADAITYGPYHGYTLMDRDGKEPAFAFGYGLSYASFTYRALNVRRAAGGIEAWVSVRNESSITADEVVQLYIGPPGKAAERPTKLLRGFKRITLGPGETRAVRMFVPEADLCWWNPETRSWALESGVHTVMMGSSSRVQDLLSTHINL